MHYAPEPIAPYGQASAMPEALLDHSGWMGGWHLASLPKRLAAAAIDIGLLVAIIVVLSLIARLIPPQMGQSCFQGAFETYCVEVEQSAGWFSTLTVFLVMAVWFANRIVVQGRTCQSLGKRVMGLYLVRPVISYMGEADGPAFVYPNMARTLGREIVHIIDVITVYGVVRAAWSRRRQMISDVKANTVVIDQPIEVLEGDGMDIA